MQKNVLKIFFLLASWRSMVKIDGSGSGSISQRHGSADPDPHQNVMDTEHCWAADLLIGQVQLKLPSLLLLARWLSLQLLQHRDHSILSSCCAMQDWLTETAMVYFFRRRTRQSWTKSNAGLSAWFQDWKDRATRRSYWSWTYLSGGEKTPGGYGPNLQDCEGDRQSGSQYMVPAGSRWKESDQKCRLPTQSEAEGTRLEIRRNFFSNRVIDNWNMIPSAVKNARTVASFNLSFKNHRKSLVSCT